MRDLPIIFSPPMVRAELEDRKRMTRRLEKCLVKTYPNGRKTLPVVLVERDSPWTKVKAGDRLWVREEWRVSNKWDSTKPADLPPRALTVLFTAGGSIANTEAGWAPDLAYPPAGEPPGWAGRRRPGMHMPRWASRLTLIVTGTKIERLHEISEEDAIAEGVVYVDHGIRNDGHLAEGWHHDPNQAALGSNFCLPSARGAFCNLWRSLHGEESWDANPFVVAISFDVIKANIDAIARAAA